MLNQFGPKWHEKKNMPHLFKIFKLVYISPIFAGTLQFGLNRIMQIDPNRMASYTIFKNLFSNY